jgi:ParB-like chromosome segregation protein Spo0J
MMADEDYASFMDDIKANGIVDKVIYLQGNAIVDGRQRYRAACELGLAGTLDYREMPKGSNLVAFILSRNLQRRHLSESQRATIAAKLANMGVGGDRVSEHSAYLQNGISQSDAAKMLGVSTRLVAAARAVIDSGNNELLAQVERGEVAATKAESIVKGKASKPRQPKESSPLKELNEKLASVIIDEMEATIASQATRISELEAENARLKAELEALKGARKAPNEPAKTINAKTKPKPKAKPVKAPVPVFEKGNAGPKPVRDPSWSTVEYAAVYENWRAAAWNSAKPFLADLSIDYFEWYGQGSDAGRAALAKSAMKRLAIKHHPDKGGDADAMARVNVAYQWLEHGQIRNKPPLGWEPST